MNKELSTDGIDISYTALIEHKERKSSLRRFA